jgi:hypothetical protein
MRLKARAKIQYGEIEFKPEDILDVPNELGIALINRDLAMPWNLEDPAQRSKSVDEIEVAPLPDVPPVTISPTSDDMGAGAGAGTFAVTITGPGTSGTWTVTKDGTASWLTYTPMTPQSTDGAVNYAVTANAGAERIAHFYVNGKTFTITQAGVAARSGAHRR